MKTKIMELLEKLKDSNLYSEIAREKIAEEVLKITEPNSILNLFYKEKS